MTILINDNRWLHDLQHDFNRVFPFLKIEFFKKKHSEKQASRALRLVQPNTQKVGDVRKSHEEGELGITGNMTVAQLEAFFVKQFNISVQVFRKAGRLWLETRITNGWTLQQQNEHGRHTTKSRGERPELFW